LDVGGDAETPVCPVRALIALALAKADAVAPAVETPSVDEAPTV